MTDSTRENSGDPVLPNGSAEHAAAGAGGDRSAADDRSSWNEAIRRYHRRVVLSVLALGLRCDRAEEVAQATWAKLIESRRSGRLGELQLPGIAIAQARFLALHELRRERLERRHGEACETAPPGFATAPDASPEQRLLTQEQSERALAAVAAMSPSAQQVFRLLYANPGIAHAQVAERLGLSVQRIRQILCELRKKVRAEIQGEE